MPDGRSLSPGLPDVHAVSVLVSKGAGFVRLCGLLLLPVARRGPTRGAAARRPGGRSPRSRSWSGARRRCGSRSTTVRAAADLFVGNYVVHDGALSDIVLTGPRPDVVPAPVWAIVVAVASIAGVVLAVIAAHACARAVRRAHPAPGPHPIRSPSCSPSAWSGYLGGYVVAMLTGIQVYDRYVLPVLPAAGMLLLRARAPGPTRRRDAEPGAAGPPSGRRCDRRPRRARRARVRVRYRLRVVRRRALAGRRRPR